MKLGIDLEVPLFEWGCSFSVILH